MKGSAQPIPDGKSILYFKKRLNGICVVETSGPGDNLKNLRMLFLILQDDEGILLGGGGRSLKRICGQYLFPLNSGFPPPIKSDIVWLSDGCRFWVEAQPVRAQVPKTRVRTTKRTAVKSAIAFIPVLRNGQRVSSSLPYRYNRHKTENL